MLVAIIACIVDTQSQRTGQLAISMMYPVQDLMKQGLALHLAPQLTTSKRRVNKHTGLKENAIFKF